MQLGINMLKLKNIWKLIVLNTKINKAMTFTLVSEAEANLKEGKLSISSPIGKALFGKAKGDKVMAQTPAGAVEFQITNISL
jgi:transcription elongation factor GreA